MLEKLRKNKTLLSILTLLVFVIIGVIAGLCIYTSKKDDSEGTQKPGINIESESDETGKEDKDSASDKLYNGDGLDVQKKDDGTVENRTDVSDIWGQAGDSDDSNSQGSINNSEEEKPNEEKPNEEKPNEEKPNEEQSEEDILVDDKNWGKIF